MKTDKSFGYGLIDLLVSLKITKAPGSLHWHVYKMNKALDAALYAQEELKGRIASFGLAAQLGVQYKDGRILKDSTERTMDSSGEGESTETTEG